MVVVIRNDETTTTTTKSTTERPKQRATKMTIRRTVTVSIAVTIVLGLVAFGRGNSSADDLRRDLRLKNDTGSRVDLFWIHPATGDKSRLSSPYIEVGQVFSMNTFVGHRFQANELPAGDSQDCGGQHKTCRVNYITVEEEHTEVTIDREFQVRHGRFESQAQSEASDMVDLCRKRGIESVDRRPNAEWSAESAAEIVDGMIDCVARDVADRFERIDEELAFQARVRTKMGGALENHTCADANLPYTEPTEVREWVREGDDDEPLTVNVMVDRKSSKIHVVENFVKPEECAAMEKQAAPLLHAATVADSKGGSQLSDTRKAMQAGIKVNWSKEKYGDPVAVLSRRVFDYTNHATGLALKEDGQEDLMSIQYFGRGETDKAPDRYLPHCDGDCDGTPHKTGTRVATMVMYCDVADKGGSTNFRNSYVNVKAKRGSAVFFSYMNADDKTMDRGFTEHSGCPVVHGAKRIVTQWMRLGVDKQNPWDSFNTLGVKIADTYD